MAKSLSQTSAPKKDRIKGSKVNPKGSASSEKSASEIKFDAKTIVALNNKLKEFIEKHSNEKITLNDLKAVYRRGLGAYSTSHRPNIPRSGWAMARVNAFLSKAGGGEYKKAYVQDDDLMKYADGGEVGQDIKCRRCGWEWNTSQSEEYDKYVCHNCGFDNRTFYDVDPIGYADGGEVNEEALQLIDIISMNPKNPKYDRYKDLLKSKFNIDYDMDYGNNDEKIIDNANLEDLRDKNDFLNYENYVKYAKKIFRLRGFIENQPYHIEGIVDIELASKIGKELDFQVVFKDYNETGNYAEVLGDTMRMPKEVDINTFIHEIGHLFDHQYSKEYNGKAKNSLYATSLYFIGRADEVFAENFMTYFIAPDWLKNNLSEVYYELDEKIPNNYKEIINNLIDSQNSENLNLKYAKGGEVDKHKETYAKWKLLVNMSKGELEKFYNSQEGKDAGLSTSEANEQGISSGRESARMIIKMKETTKDKWTDTMWKWANKQISFISRMSGMQGELYDDKGNKTRKHTSLLIWGHNPKKSTTMKFDNRGEIIFYQDFRPRERKFKIGELVFFEADRIKDVEAKILGKVDEKRVKIEILESYFPSKNVKIAGDEKVDISLRTKVGLGRESLAFEKGKEVKIGTIKVVNQQKINPLKGYTPFNYVPKSKEFSDIMNNKMADGGEIKYEGNFQKDLEFLLKNEGWNVSFYDNNINEVSKEKATKIVVSRFDPYYESVTIKAPSKMKVTFDWVMIKVNNDKVYKTFYENFNQLLKSKGFKNVNAYPTTYGIGVFVAFGMKIEETKKIIENLLNSLGIEYTTEYSDAQYIFRYKISKSKSNIDKINSLSKKYDKGGISNFGKAGTGFDKYEKTKGTYDNRGVALKRTNDIKTLGSKVVISIDSNNKFAWNLILQNGSLYATKGGFNTQEDAIEDYLKQEYEDGGLIEETYNKVLEGKMNSDDGAIFLDENGIEVTDDVYDKLRNAENLSLKKSRGLQVGDIITIKGKNGSNDFSANFRGYTNEGKLIVVYEGGKQMAISKDEYFANGGEMEKELDTMKMDADRYLPKIISAYANGGEVDIIFKLNTPTKQPTKLNYIQQVLVRTTEFKKWFGDWEKCAESFLQDNKSNFLQHYKNCSIVIDLTTLEPQVVYHGTNFKEEFYTFDVTKKEGVGRPYGYFADNIEYSQNFTTSSQRGQHGLELLYKCFLNIKNPFMATTEDFYDEVDNQIGWGMKISKVIAKKNYGENITDEQWAETLKVVLEQIGTYIYATFGYEDKPFWLLMARDTKKEFKYFLMSHGFDGVRYAEEFKGVYDVDNPAEFTKAWTIFDANQVKLADGRNIDFDPLKEDIRYEEGGSLTELNQEDMQQENMSKAQMLRNTIGVNKFAEGGTVKGDGKHTNDAKKGGFFDGKSHADGGIKAVNKDTGQMLEVEGNEVIINKRSVADDTKREFEGKMMTNREILSTINEMGGGVSFKEGGEINEKSCKCMGKKYKFGGNLISDYDIVKELTTSYNDVIKKPISNSINYVENLINKINGNY